MSGRRGKFLNFYTEATAISLASFATFDLERPKNFNTGIVLSGNRVGGGD